MASHPMLPPPMPPGALEAKPENLFSEEVLLESFAGAGVRAGHTACFRCLKTRDAEHRIRYLDCEEVCALCGNKRHKGMVGNHINRRGCYSQFAGLSTDGEVLRRFLHRSMAPRSL
jgi:hypothetical protein